MIAETVVSISALAILVLIIKERLQNDKEDNYNRINDAIIRDRNNSK